MTTKTKRKAPNTVERTSIGFKLTPDELEAFNEYRARIDVPPSLNALAKACALVGIAAKNTAADMTAKPRKAQLKRKAARS